jgi:hypothetical protein
MFPKRCLDAVGTGADRPHDRCCSQAGSGAIRLTAQLQRVCQACCHTRGDSPLSRKYGKEVVSQGIGRLSQLQPKTLVVPATGLDLRLWPFFSLGGER